MILTEIEDLFWGLIARPKGGYDQKLTEAQARLYIWRSICKLARRTKPVLLRTGSSISVVADTQEYPLAEDFWMWLPLERICLLGRPLPKFKRVQLDNLAPGWSLSTNPAGAPQGYYEAGSPATGTNRGRRVIGVTPMPGGSYTLTYQYLRIPRTFADLSADVGFDEGTEDYPDIPADFHDAPALDAARFFWLKSNEAPTVDPAELDRRFELAVSELAQQTREELQSDFLDTVSDAGSAATESFWDGYEGR